MTAFVKLLTETSLTFSECPFSEQVPLYKAKIQLVNLTGEGWLHIKWDAIDSSETGMTLLL